MNDPKLWTPGSPPVTAGDVSTTVAKHGVTVIHVWAVWNGHDRFFDQDFRAVREAFADLVAFRSADIDEHELRPFIMGWDVQNVPTLVGFANGRRVANLRGHRRPEEIRTWIDSLLAIARQPD